MIDGSEKRKCQLVFELQSSRHFMKSTVINRLEDFPAVLNHFVSSYDNGGS